EQPVEPLRQNDAAAIVERGITVASSSAKGDQAPAAGLADGGMQLREALRSARGDPCRGRAAPSGERHGFPSHRPAPARTAGRARRTRRNAKGKATKPSATPNHSVATRMTAVATRAVSNSTPMAESRASIVASVPPSPPGNSEIAPTISAKAKMKEAWAKPAGAPSARRSR